MNSKKPLSDSGVVEKLCNKIDLLIDCHQKQSEQINRLLEQNDQLISMMLDSQDYEQSEAVNSQFYLDGTRK